MELSLGDRLVFKERQAVTSVTTVATKRKDASETIPSLRANIAKNEFATVMAISRQPDGSLDVLCQLDTPKEDGTRNLVRLNSRAMGEIDHAFATTVHRSQGMTVDSVFAVPGVFLSKELFYVMATRHRERLSIHMLEANRASILAKAGQNMAKLHGSDLAAMERAGADSSLGITGRLQASTDRLLALMQKERARFTEVMAGSLSLTKKWPAVQAGMRARRETRATLDRILQSASALQKKTTEWVQRQRNRDQFRKTQTAQVSASVPLAQYR